MKPKCQEPGCENNAELSNRAYHKDYYRKVCSKHKRLKYGMPTSSKRQREYFHKIKKGICVICGWKGPCDIHRIVHGNAGGRYTRGNVVEICPNCHRLEHQGLMKIDWDTLPKL